MPENLELCAERERGGQIGLLIIPKKNFGEMCIHVDRGRVRERDRDRETYRDL